MSSTLECTRAAGTPAASTRRRAAPAGGSPRTARNPRPRAGRNGLRYMSFVTAFA